MVPLTATAAVFAASLPEYIIIATQRSYIVILYPGCKPIRVPSSSRMHSSLTVIVRPMSPLSKARMQVMILVVLAIGICWFSFTP